MIVRGERDDFRVHRLSSTAIRAEKPAVRCIERNEWHVGSAVRAAVGNDADPFDRKQPQAERGEDKGRSRLLKRAQRADEESIELG